MNGKGVLEVGNNGGFLCFIGCYGLHLPESGKGVWELRRYGGSLLLRGAYFTPSLSSFPLNVFTRRAKIT